MSYINKNAAGVSSFIIPTNEIGVAAKDNKDTARVIAGLTGLQMKVLKMYDPDKKQKIQVQLIGGFIWSGGDGKVKINIDPIIMPILYDFSKGFTRYRLQSILACRGKYTKRLYMEFNNWLDKGYFRMDIEAWKQLLELPDTYHRYSNFKNRVIMSSLAEINAMTELNVELQKEEKRGSRVTHMLFKVSLPVVPLNQDQQHYYTDLVEKYRLSTWQANNAVRELSIREIRTALWNYQRKQETVSNVSGYLWTMFVNLGVSQTKRYL